jgi:hypothetical protein
MSQLLPFHYLVMGRGVPPAQIASAIEMGCPIAGIDRYGRQFSDISLSKDDKLSLEKAMEKIEVLARWWFSDAALDWEDHDPEHLAQFGPNSFGFLEDELPDFEAKHREWCNANGIEVTVSRPARQSSYWQLTGALIAQFHGGDESALRRLTASRSHDANELATNLEAEFDITMVRRTLVDLIKTSVGAWLDRERVRTAQ